jgi:ribosomal protein S18 acetylase RimI-like enzyme
MSAVKIRRARLPQDEPGIARIDKGFTADAIFEIAAGRRALKLERTRTKPFVKRFEVYDLGRDWRQWDEAHVAVDAGRIVGFVSSSYQFWNRRVVLWHLYVEPGYRRQGLGEKLLAKVFERAGRKKALAVFLETSNLNVPGIAWYEKRGFVLGGVDTTLYSGAPDAEEFGIYLVKRVLAPK